MSFIHSQTSTVAPLKFGNGYVISSRTLMGMWLLIHADMENMLKLYCGDNLMGPVSIYKYPLYRYGDSHYKDKPISCPFYHYKGVPYTDKTTFYIETDTWHRSHTSSVGICIRESCTLRVHNTRQFHLIGKLTEIQSYWFKDVRILARTLFLVTYVPWCMPQRRPYWIFALVPCHIVEVTASHMKIGHQQIKSNGARSSM